MRISIIVAVANNKAIGKDNDLLWHLPKDMKFFKETTTGHVIVTGRKNYLSIPERFRPLPNRENVVLTRNRDFKEEGAIVVHTLEAAVEYGKKNGEEELFIIGGGEIYKLALPIADKIYYTSVDTVREDADTFFPEIGGEWKLVSEDKYEADEKNKFAMNFQVWERK